MKEGNESYGEIVGGNKRSVGGSDLFSEVDWFDGGSCGIKVKGISVNGDSFMSIGNVSKGNDSEGIKVM